MVTRYFFVYTAFLAVSGSANAQQDSVLLDPVEVSGSHFQRFSSGAKYRSVEMNPSSQTLDEILSGENSIYFKTYGNGQLSTISFRGTSASHTNILWHGISANYPTLGQMDFSQWPAWLISSVALHPGSAGALYGSGAIGGTVLLESEARISNQNYAMIKGGVGSFGALFTGLEGNYSLGKWRGNTKIYRDFIVNDFPYEFGGKSYDQPNASVLNYGFSQKLNYQITSEEMLFLDAQYTLNDREIQPSKLSPDQRDELQTENVRIAVGYRSDHSRSSLSSTVAFLSNDQLYNEDQRTVSRQYSAMISYWQELAKRLDFRLGVNTNIFTADSDSYTEQFTDWQSDVYASLKWRLFGWWTATLNLRQSFYEGSRPFTPSLGQEWMLLSNQEHRVRISQQLSAGFRFPTLNDQYWSPGGNPDLQPEESLSAEVSATWIYATGNFKSDFSVTGFRTWSDNWIIWLPGNSGFWIPSNFRKVQILGLEMHWQNSFSILGALQEVRMNYSYTAAENLTGSHSGNQLPYTPRHNGAFRWNTSLQDQWSVAWSANWTGKRYTTLDNIEIQSVAGFALFDMSVEKQWDWKEAAVITAGFSVKNLLNANYENLQNRAMPGRNFQLNFQFKF